MYCKNCGAAIEDTAAACPFCQTPTAAPEGAQQAGYQQPYQQPTYQQQPYQQVPVDDRPSCWIGGICFFIPIIGLILYLVWKDQKPLSAKAAGKTALIGFILQVVFSVIGTILSIVIGASAFAMFGI